MTSMPTLFISHGGPNIVLDDTEARRYLTSVSSLLPDKPRAIVIVSAHFETDGVAVVADPAPDMIYDFGGFAPELYEMVYPAKGDPGLAEEVLDRLEAAGLQPHKLERRGYDHGTWTPLLLAFPDADIPVVQVSIDPKRDAAWHYAIGAALADLRKDGVLLIGSGHITHNLRAFFSAFRSGAPIDQALAEKVEAFTGWFAKNLAKGDRQAILNWKQSAPFPDDNHPTDEHLMPIFFALGAAGEGAQAERVHNSKQMGAFAFDSYLFQ